jgi:hypothetical protein
MCALFNDAVSRCEYVASKIGSIDYWIDKYLNRSGCGLFKLLSRHLCTGSEENHETILRNNRCLGRDWK